MKDYAQLLAVCLAYIDKRLKEQHTIVEEVTHAVISEQDRISIIEEAVSKSPVQSLPDGLVFESHLEEVRRVITETKEKTETDFDNKLFETFSDLYNNINRNQVEIERVVSGLSKQDHVHDQYSEKDHEHEQYSKQNHVHDQYSEKDHEHDQYATNDDFAGLAELFDTKATSDIKIIEDVRSRLEYIKTEFGSLIKELQENNAAVLSSTFETTNKELQTLRSYVQLIKEEQNKLLTKTRKTLDEVHSSLLKELDDKSSKDHLHSEYATRKETDDLARGISLSEERDVALDKAIKDVFYSLNSKADITSVVKREDLQQLSEEIREAVIARIDKPKDGKDAFEWEFQNHPKAPGVLQYKRSDWKAWKNVSMPRSTTSNTNSFIYGAGGGGGDGGSGASAELKVVNIQLEGLNQTITPIDHKLTNYYSYRVIKETGEEVSLVVTENTLNFSLNANTDMAGLTLQIRGY